MCRWSVVLAGWLLGGSLRPAHPTHTSYGRLQIEPTAITLRLRVFRDDLEKGLAAFHHLSHLTIDASRTADSLFAPYLSQRLVLTADGAALVPTVLSSAPDAGMWTYAIRFPLAQPARTVAISDQILFDTFPDQQNLLKVVHLPSGEEESLYFVPNEPGPVTLRFGPK